MKTKDSSRDLFFRTIPPIVSTGAELDIDIRQQIETLERISQMMDMSIYVVDFYHACFRYISNHHLFLCGYLPEEVLQWGYEFYPRILNADLHLVANLHQAVYHYLHHPDTRVSDIEYIACNFNIRNSRLPLMVCHKVIPLMVCGRPQLAVCTVTESVRTTSGNLVAYYKDQDDYDQYNCKAMKWERQKAINLTPQERQILKSAKHGKSPKEIADMLCVTNQTIRNELKQIYQKLDVHSLHQAIIYTRNHHINLL